jgi:hypothetical protein
MDVISKVLKWTGISLLGAFTVVAVLFTAGEALSDPGGWQGLGLVALWLIPLAALGWWFATHPDQGAKVATGLVVAMVLIDLWAAWGPGSWSAWENHHGPWRAVLTFAVGGLLAVLAIERTRRAGVLLVVLGGLTMVLSVSVRGSSPLAVVAVPILLCGLMILASTVGQDHSAADQRAASAVG